LIKNGKYFVAPQKSWDNFKVLFARLAAEGAGRPVDRHGIADGPWTAEKLADAISAIEGNHKGIDLRAVQVWFQDNDNGISNDNIRWLARIFGCDDPEETSKWQAELMSSKDRLASERREKRKLESTTQDSNRKSEDAGTVAATEQLASSRAADEPTKVKSPGRETRSLAEKCEWVFTGSVSLNLMIIYWLVFCGLGLMNYVLNTLSVTYSPMVGLDKQVGFVWAPTLTALPLIALPLYIYYVNDLNTYWKHVGRSKCSSVNVISVGTQSHAAWYVKVNDFSFSFWAIGLFCLFFVFGFQWSGIYLPAYLSGDTNGVQIDRYLLALVRPEIISVPEAMALSFFGYLYTASYISVFMFGLLFLVIVALDYHDICTTSDLEGNATDEGTIRKEGQKLVWGGFRIVVFALWLSLLIKLQITYLSSDSPNFLNWLVTDTLSVFGAADVRNGWLENSSISHFTTFLMMAVTVTVSVVCALKVLAVFERLSVYGGDYPFARDQWAVLKMLVVVASLSLSVMLVGRFTGFSLFVAVSILASFHVLSGPKLRAFEVGDGTG